MLYSMVYKMMSFFKLSVIILPVKYDHVTESVPYVHTIQLFPEI